MRILLVEDDSQLFRAIQQGLHEEGMEVVHVIEAAAALDRGGGADLDVLVIDVGLPDGDGLERLYELRRAHPQVPVLVLTEAVEMRAQALELGADNCLLMPCTLGDLMSRIRALARRAGEAGQTPHNDDIVILDDGHVMHFAGRSHVTLSPREYALLAYLLRRRGEVVPRNDILREVFGCAADPGVRTIDLHLSHLRRKLTGAAVRIEAVCGAGIRVEVDDSGA